MTSTKPLSPAAQMREAAAQLIYADLYDDPESAGDAIRAIPLPPEPSLLDDPRVKALVESDASWLILLLDAIASALKSERVAGMREAAKICDDEISKVEDAIRWGGAKQYINTCKSAENAMTETEWDALADAIKAALDNPAQVGVTE